MNFQSSLNKTERPSLLSAVGFKPRAVLELPAYLVIIKRWNNIVNHNRSPPKKMNWLTSLLFVACIGGAHLQCFSPNDNNFRINNDFSDTTDFGLDLYRELAPANSPRNFFFSPYSIWSAFTLAYFGSAGNTQKQLEAALRVADKASAVKRNQALNFHFQQRQVNNSLSTFNLANRAYFHSTLKLKQCTADILHNEMRVVNFRDLSGSANKINQFVSDTTKGRIDKVVAPRDLIDAVMVLVNAAFFKGTWKYQFKKSDTRLRDFFINEQDSAPLAMMSAKQSFRFREDSQLKARVLELPYDGEDVSMFLLLPSTDLPLGDRFNRMVNNMNGPSLRKALDTSQMPSLTVDVQLPKFKFTMKLGKEIETAMKKMGVVDIFDGKLANMTGFDEFEDLSIDKIIHKAFIEVNEEGTEAGAITALFSFTRSSLPRVVNFHCNEPFVFLIRENVTKNILFMGAIKNPKG